MNGKCGSGRADRYREQAAGRIGPATLLTRLGLAAAVLCAGALVFTGCEDSSRPAAAAHPPAIRPAAPSLASTARMPALLPLPLTLPDTATIALDAMPADGAARLAKQVEVLFAAGQKDYQAGLTETARQEFDQALSMLDASGFDVQQEPLLSNLSGELFKAVQQEETNSPGQTADAEGSEPVSPLDEIAASAEETPEEPASAGLRNSAEGELKAVSHDLPLTVNDTVLSFLNFFQTPHGRAIVETGLRRAGRYRPMIQRVLREEGLPVDLMYMAQAESAFQPQALSKAGARGLWQFMSFRGKQYGLQHSWWVDDRQDPEKATRAAAHHLRDLYDMFGDWYLVMAAYDSGPGTVQHAIERTGYADFWQLYKANVLPKETRNYVPIIVALTLIAKDPGRYGIDVDPEQPVTTDNVAPGHPVDLRLVAETIDSDVDTLRSLNPQLLRLVTPADPAFVLHLPEGTAAQFQEEMAAIPPQDWTSWRRYRVEPGDTVAGVARKYGVSTASLREANGLDADADLDSGANLIIPTPVPAAASEGQLVRYRMRRTDTLASVADEFDVTVPELKKWNHLRGNRVGTGVRLKIYLGGTGAPPEETKTVASVSPTPRIRRAAGELSASAAPVTHRVVAGETLWSIARAYQTTVDALRAGNQFLFSRPLQVGDMLTIGAPR